jgi:predicted permease
MQAWNGTELFPEEPTMLTDLRNALRQLRKSPGFAITAILTLALGIGATTAIFTLVNAVLLRSLPVKDPGQLWRVGDNEQCCNDGGLPSTADGGVPNDWSLFSYEQYREFRENTPGFESLAAFQSNDQTMAVRREGSNHPAQPLYAEFVSGNSFDTLGLRPYAGRLLRSSDDSRGAAPVAVMSFQTWEEKFGRSPSVIGSSLVVNGRPITVVGIGPPGFFGERITENPPSLWLPLHLNAVLSPQTDQIDHPETQWLNLIGRVAPGTAISPIQARMNVELLEFLRSPLSKITGPEAKLIPKQYLRLSPGGAGVKRMQNSYKSDLHLLMWISSFVLLIACANLANLMLARSATQRQQISVRTALGASRGRLVQRALAECLALAFTGGLAGLLVAWGGARLILHLAFENNPVTVDLAPSFAVLGFAFGVSLLTGLLFGVAPAWMAAHADPIDALRGANRSTGRHATLAQKMLVVAQAGVSVVLLCAAGFLILSMNRLEHQNFGFETANRIIAEIAPQDAGYQPDQLQNLYRQLHDTLAGIPGVKRVAFSFYSPMSGDDWVESVAIEGQKAPPPGSYNDASWMRVTPDYFSSVGTKLLDGRVFTRADDSSSRDVAVVNEAFVKKFLQGQNPIGAHFGDWEPSITNTYTIVGVVEDTQYWDPTKPVPPMYFVPEKQTSVLPPTDPRVRDYADFMDESHYLTNIVIQTNGYVPGLEAQVRSALAKVNPNLMLIDYHSFAQQVALAFSQQAMIVQLTSLFGALALVLAAIGLYGVTAYTVAQRTREIGVRMALGANRLHVQRMVLRGAFLQVGVGLLIGIPAAIGAGHLMAAQLFGVSGYNPVVLGLSILVLGAAALIAAVVPARRASGVDPMEALRIE